MIGREGQVKPFELIRWARKRAAVHQLRTLEAHVLLLLATYANADGIAWPSIKTLAVDSGLRPTKDGRNSAVSAALSRLEDLQLIWTRQGGHGHPAKRELLFDPAKPSAYRDGYGAANGHQPSADADSTVPQPSVVADGSGPSRPVQPSGLPDAQPSGLPDQKYQGNGHAQLPTGTARGSRPATRKASHPDPGMVERTAVRQQIAASLAATGEAA